MKYLRRFLYMIYYLKESDMRQLKDFLRYSASLSGKSRRRIIGDVIHSVLKYNVSIKDYFYFRFFELKDKERSEWAGTGYMYEYQLKMNPKGPREILENKIHFLNRFKSFVNRDFCTLDEMRNSSQRVEQMLGNPSGRLVLKGSMGQVGAEVEIIDCNDFNPQELIDYMTKCKYNLAEEYVVQHPSLMELSSSGLNTIRIFTQLHDNEVIFLGARLRISVNSKVDNMAAGNLATPVDIKTGVVSGPGVYSDITKENKEFHPVTGKKITGFQVPFWDQVIDLSKGAARLVPENKSVGWDIAITEKGCELIEGNHNWCKLLWQLPVNKGLKCELEKYI